MSSSIYCRRCGFSYPGPCPKHTTTGTATIRMGKVEDKPKPSVSERVKKLLKRK